MTSTSSTSIQSWRPSTMRRLATAVTFRSTSRVFFARTFSLPPSARTMKPCNPPGAWISKNFARSSCATRASMVPAWGRLIEKGLESIVGAESLDLDALDVQAHRKEDVLDAEGEGSHLDVLIRHGVD